MATLELDTRENEILMATLELDTRENEIGFDRDSRVNVLERMKF